MADLTNRGDFLRLAVSFEGSLILVAGAVGWLAGVNPLQSFAWDGRAVLWGMAATAPLFGLFLIAYFFPVGPLRGIKEFLHEALAPSLVACRWYDLLLISAMAGLSEEVLFRGVLQPLMGLGWSNLVFGLAHFITPLYAILAGAVGVYLGWLFDETDNLLAPIVAHGLYDFLAFLVLAHASRRALREVDSCPSDPPCPPLG